MTLKKLMFVFGTRPEAIKLAPLVLQAKNRSGEFETRVVVTAQHREMLDDVLQAFHIAPDIDLNIMKPGQSLFHVTSRIFTEMDAVLQDIDPDIVVVQGDTTTTFAGAMAAYYARKKVAYVEAGLRTGDKWAPFPEEINRKATSTVADYLFPPTEKSKQNLLKEGYPEESIFVTGNTVIDALCFMKRKMEDATCPMPDFGRIMNNYRRMVLITGHRRENFGEPFLNICNAFRELSGKFPETAFVYPVHLNPNVQKPVNEILQGLDNFFLLPPLGYPGFIWTMLKSHMIITDSGGVQEEAPALGKPVLVTRKKSERPEAIEAGVVKLVGDAPEAIIKQASLLLTDEDQYKQMSRGVSPYGDGKASERILDVLNGKKTPLLSKKDSSNP